MELARLSAPLARFDRVGPVLGTHSGVVLVRCTDAPTVVASAAYADAWTTPIGVWLELTEGYRAALAARDVATLSWLLALTHVVVSTTENAASHARVLEALLSDEEVTLRNEVATLRHAYNRPAPPRDITVWSWDGATLRHGEITLVEHSSEVIDVGVLTYFAPDPTPVAGRCDRGECGR